jgi:myotubularin-related protein 6/7/8
VRDAIGKIYELGNTTTANGGAASSGNQWLASLEASNWLQLMAKILQATNQIVESMQIVNVVVHCTDGWDRTAQLCSLA